MTFRNSILSVAGKLLVCVSIAGGLALIGCGSETVQTAEGVRAEQEKLAAQDSNQAGKGNKAKIQTKSVKSLIKKDFPKE